MSPEAKDAISHRGRALRALAPVIAAWLAGAEAGT
jgi:inosine/xanthosine triphosphate pyrophosphatase family protein